MVLGRRSGRASARPTPASSRCARPSRSRAETGPPETMLSIAAQPGVLPRPDRPLRGGPRRWTWTAWRRARRVGLELRFGAGLRASAGDILLRCGRWDEAERMTREGLDLDDGDRLRVALSPDDAGHAPGGAGRSRGPGGRARRGSLASAESDIDPDVRALRPAGAGRGEPARWPTGRRARGHRGWRSRSSPAPTRSSSSRRSWSSG